MHLRAACGALSKGTPALAPLSGSARHSSAPTHLPFSFPAPEDADFMSVKHTKSTARPSGAGVRCQKGGKINATLHTE